MLKLLLRSRPGRLAGATLLVAALAAPAAAEPVYSWRTEDGGYAFTDDPKAIPPRYRDQAEVRETERLEDYKRYTPADDHATQRYAEQLDRRLERLRRLNAPRPQPTAVYAPAPVAAGPSPSISMRSDEGFAPSVEISEATGDSGEPIVVDTLFTRPEGKMVTRQTTVVRQGDRVLSIVRPRLREWNVADDIHDEADLER
jgi:hypothetical protein